MSNLRNQTMNRLAEATFNSPCSPLPMPTMPLAVFEQLLYKTIYENGYNKSKADFLNDFIQILTEKTTSQNIIQKDTFENFPSVGSENSIYVDTTKNEIYYWKDSKYFKISVNPEEVFSEGVVLLGGNASTM